jgi:hypothetical protein
MAMSFDHVTSAIPLWRDAQARKLIMDVAHVLLSIYMRTNGLPPPFLSYADIFHGLQHCLVRQGPQGMSHKLMQVSDLMTIPCRGWVVLLSP